MLRKLLIRCPDGRTKIVPLEGPRLVVGRAATAGLSFPDDADLSRQHFALEAENEEWTVRDLGSKNGTFVNSVALEAPQLLQPGDRIAAGHLAIVYAPESRQSIPGVVVFDGGATPAAATVITSLEGALSGPAPRQGTGTVLSPMRALMRFDEELSGNIPLADLFPLTLHLALEAVNARRGVLLILEDGKLAPKAFEGEHFRISTTVRDRVLQERSSILVRDALRDHAFRDRMSIVEQKVHAMMAVPLQTKDRIVGLLYVDSPIPLEFTDDDLGFLTIMANVAAMRIENARLAEIEEAERLLRRDLDQAAEIQRRTLPEKAPDLPQADLAGFNAACRTVGGDYYDFFPFPDGRVAVALGDVSGKGLPASLMMMSLQARVQVLAEEPGDLAMLMTRLNKTTCASCPANRFITFFFCVLDAATGELAFANAGHNAPVLVRASGEALLLEGGGPVLGILPWARYTEDHAHLDRGDMLVLYSDGITEAANAALEEFGEERFIELLQRNRERPAAAIVESVKEALTQFTAGAPQADDMTLVVARRI